VITVVHNKNQGPLLSRVQGIEHTKGEVLLFLDSDDSIRNDALGLLKERFEDEKCDMVIFNASLDPCFIQSFRKYNMKDESVFEGQSKAKLYELLVSSSDLNNMCLKAIRKRIANIDIDGKECLYIRHGEDLLQLLPIITRAEKIVFVNQNIYYYRQREGSLIHKFDINRKNSVKKVHLELEKYIEIWGMYELKGKHYAREIRGWIDSLQLLMDNKRHLSHDEYCREFTIEELEDELITWGEQQEIRYMKHIPEGVPDEVFGGKKYLVESTKDDYDITIPFDHMEYEKLEIERDNWRYGRQSYYSKDKDGYDFMKGDFC
jgi:glycosyltransferase involved in cell wall biosynthesis